MIVTLLTDFGTSDYFVAAMKAVILSHDPRIRVVDISHDVPPQDIGAAAFLLLAVQADFPPGTVHAVVVDPGVGSARRAIACAVDGHFLVGPDNGVLAWVLQRGERVEVRTIENPNLRREPMSTTFHGRDLFAPAAAALAAGFPFEDVGVAVDDWVHGAELEPSRSGAVLHGRILHVDAFGNCITNFTRELLPELRRGSGSEISRARPQSSESFVIRTRDALIGEIRDHFAAGPPGVPFAIWGSAGFLEIAVDRGSAAELLGVSAGDPVTVSSR